MSAIPVCPKCGGTRLHENKGTNPNGKLYGKHFVTCGSPGCRFFRPNARLTYYIPKSSSAAVIAALGTDIGADAAERKSLPTSNLRVGLEAHYDIEAKRHYFTAATKTDHRKVREALESPELQGRKMGKSKYDGNAVTYPYPEGYKDVLRKLSSLRDPHVEIDVVPSWVDTAIEEANKYDQAMDKEVTFNAGGLFGDLRPFQKDFVSWAIQRDGCVLLADEMGLGKTIQSLAVAHHYRDDWPLLIVCPSSLTHNWQEEIRRWCHVPIGHIHVVVGRKKLKNVPVGCRVVICSYSCLQALADISKEFDTCIVDECHYIKTPTSQRSVALLNIAKECKHRILLSGTPAMSRPIELHAQLRLVNEKALPKRDEFGARYCGGGTSNPYSHQIEFKGHSNLQELRILLRNVMLRREKKEVLKDLPAKLRSVKFLKISDSERKQMKNALEQVRKTRDFTSSFELFEMTARAKLPAIKEYVIELLRGGAESGDIADEEDDGDSGALNNNNKVLIFGHHKEMLDGLETAVRQANTKRPIDYIRIDGSTASDDRGRLCEHFRTAPRCRVAILSMLAAGTGLNFTCASQVIFSELQWAPAQLLQCEDRVHRMGQQDTCSIQYLLASDTIDDTIWTALQDKMNVTSELMSLEGLDKTDTTLVDKANIECVARRGEGADKPSAAVLAVAGGKSKTAEKGSQGAEGQTTLDGWFKKQQATGSPKATNEATDPDVIITVDSPAPTAPSLATIRGQHATVSPFSTTTPSGVVPVSAASTTSTSASPPLGGLVPARKPVMSRFDPSKKRSVASAEQPPNSTLPVASVQPEQTSIIVEDVPAAIPVPQQQTTTRAPAIASATSQPITTQEEIMALTGARPPAAATKKSLFRPRNSSTTTAPEPAPTLVAQSLSPEQRRQQRRAMAISLDDNTAAATFPPLANNDPNVGFAVGQKRPRVDDQVVILE